MGYSPWGHNELGRTEWLSTSTLLWFKQKYELVVCDMILLRGGQDGRDFGQEEKRITEDKMSGWHHRLDGHEFE